jgi:aryl-alcohol dehydrogenase-like predicted oxidoreductase
MQALWSSDRNGLARFDCLQPHYNLVHREEFERELAMVCKTYQIGVIPYSPLAGGFLTGKYRRNLVPNTARAAGAKRYFTEDNWILLELIEKLAIGRGKSVSQVSLAWLMADPLITCPIIGSNSVEQLKDNLGALDVHLTIEEKTALDQATSWREKEN